MSISRAQASALAEGFLDDIGSSKSELQPRGTFTEIILLAGEFIEDAQNNLISSKSIATGKLSASLVANEPVRDGNTLKIDVTMLFYGLFVNKGVKGTKNGSSLAGYAFKNDLPSKKMVKAIQDWLSQGVSKDTSLKNYKAPHRTISAHERKNKRLSEATGAYAIARSIKMKGLEPTGFLDKAVVSTQKKVAERLGPALRIDIINSLTQP